MNVSCKQKLQGNNTQNKTMNISNTYRPSFDPRQQYDWDEDESKEIAEQIRSKAVFLVQVKELYLKDDTGEKAPLTPNSTTLVILEVSGKNASKRWQMGEGSKYIIDKNAQSLAFWIADKELLAYSKVSNPS